MGFWKRLLGRKRDAELPSDDENVFEVYGLRCEHVQGNVYELEGARYEVNPLNGAWKCLQCDETGMTSRVPSTRAVLENLSGHHRGCHARTSVTGFTDNGDGTLTDRAAGLMWQKDDDGTERTQQEAFAYCASLSLGGFSDWRLPQLGEFQSLKKVTASNGIKVNTTYSPNGDVYWTATDPPPDFPSNVAYAADGTTFYRTNKYYVRAVRRCQGIMNWPKLKVEEKSEGHCPSCDNILPADAIRCNKGGHRFI